MERTYPVGFVVTKIPVDCLTEFVHLAVLMSSSSLLLKGIHHVPNIFIGAFIRPIFLSNVIDYSALRQNEVLTPKNSTNSVIIG